MNASELMSHDHLRVCGDQTDALEAAQLMTDHDIGAIPVLDRQGRLEGIVTDRDICCRIVAGLVGLESELELGFPVRHRDAGGREEGYEEPDDKAAVGFVHGVAPPFLG